VEDSNCVFGTYVPVGIVSFDYPTYPVNSVSWGSVVVQLTIDESGNIAKTRFLYGKLQQLSFRGTQKMAFSGCNIRWKTN
jgi:hypothetical protein